MRRIKKGDTVKVITGKDKGTVTQVESVVTKNKKIYLLLKEANLIFKTQKKTENTEGNIHRIPGLIDSSNVMLVFDEKSKVPSRVAYKVKNDVKVKESRSGGKQ